MGTRGFENSEFHLPAFFGFRAKAGDRVSAERRNHKKIAREQVPSDFSLIVCKLKHD
jgi:hypothetical protein